MFSIFIFLRNFALWVDNDRKNMKKNRNICRSIYLATCLCAGMALLPSCSKPQSAYYEKIDGEPQIDFIEFMNDSVVRYIAPGPLEMRSKYTEANGVITVYVAPLSTAKLTRIDGNTLQGSVPFFEGIWKRK